jgi:hypothetical protein
MSMPPAAPGPEGKADYTLRIAPVTVELDLSHILSTIGYKGTATWQILRMREGKRLATLSRRASYSPVQGQVYVDPPRTAR